MTNKSYLIDRFDFLIIQLVVAYIFGATLYTMDGMDQATYLLLVYLRSACALVTSGRFVYMCFLRVSFNLC